jgi:SAM-dependent methyltransferase
MDAPIICSSSTRLRSYVDSHKAPGKGDSYDAYYASNSEMRYLWAQERRVLDCLLGEWFSGRVPALLDFACGTGRITGFLEDRVASSCGVDVSDSMLAVARAKLTRTRLLKVNLLEKCPFPKGSFDLITAFRFFLNAEPELRLAVLRALEPLVARDGCLVFNVHQNRHSLYYWPERVCSRMRRIEPSVTLSIGECKRILRHVGLEIVRIYPVGLLHLPKLRFSNAARERFDRLAMRSSTLARFSDSPIVVARRQRA